MKADKPYEPHIMQKFPYIRSKKLTQAARGEVCTFGAPGCDRGSETTVWAHANYDFTGKGAGIKSSDVFGCFACQPCHDWYDGRRQIATETDREFYFWRAMVRSWNRLIELGIIKVEGA